MNATIYISVCTTSHSEYAKWPLNSLKSLSMSALSGTSLFPTLVVRKFSRITRDVQIILSWEVLGLSEDSR